MRCVARLAVLVVLLLAVVPARAETVTSLAAAQLLQQTLGPHKMLATTEGSEIITAFNKAARQNPALLGDLATLLAVARPDLIDSLKAAVQQLNPAEAGKIIDSMEQASLDPTVDQLAALARIEGAAPASGQLNRLMPSAGSDGADLGWAGYAPGNGSQE